MNNSLTLSEERKTYLASLTRRTHIISSARIFILVAFFGIWEICSRTNIIDPFIFSQPSKMLKALFNLSSDGSLFIHAGVTLSETIIGFIAGTVIGTGTAIVLWWNKIISDISEPYLVILNSLPKTALAPIIIVWIGNNINSVIATALMTSVIVTILSVLNGFLEADSEKIRLIETFGGTKKQVLKLVVLPSSIPVIVNALKINVGLSFVGVIVGEFLVARSGLGYLIVYSSQIFKMDYVMLSVILLAVMAAVLYKAVIVLLSLGLMPLAATATLLLAEDAQLLPHMSCSLIIVLVNTFILSGCVWEKSEATQSGWVKDSGKRGGENSMREEVWINIQRTLKSRTIV